MATNVIDLFWRKLAAPAVRSDGATLGLLGGPWLLPTDAPLAAPAALVAALTLTVLLGVASQFARIRAKARWRAAWDRYAELELSPAAILVQPIRHQVRGR